MQHWTYRFTDFMQEPMNSCCLSTLHLLYGLDSFFDCGQLIQVHIYWSLGFQENCCFLDQEISSEEGLEMLQLTV